MTEKTGTSACAAEPVNRGRRVQASCVKAMRVSLPGRSKTGLPHHVAQSKFLLDSQFDSLFRASTETQTEDQHLVTVRSVT